jgi:hypothetical protein
MPASPEIERPYEAPVDIKEHAEEFPAETIQQIQGAKVVQKHFTAQVRDDHGTPLIQAPPANVVTTVQPPSDQATLVQQAKGNTSSSATWNAAFWLRVVKRAFHFGWKIIGGHFVNG